MGLNDAPTNASRFRAFLARKAIDLDLIPCRLRWRKSISGIGRMYADIWKMVQQEYGPKDVERLGEVMYKIGHSQAPEILESLGMQRDLEGCIYAVLALHRIFGIRSKVVERARGMARIKISHCHWGRKMPQWGPGMCASIGQYEAGLIEGILPHAVHSYDKRFTLGDDTCELTIALSEDPTGK